MYYLLSNSPFQKLGTLGISLACKDFRGYSDNQEVRRILTEIKYFEPTMSNNETPNNIPAT